MTLKQFYYLSASNCYDYDGNYLSIKDIEENADKEVVRFEAIRKDGEYAIKVYFR